MTMNSPYKVLRLALVGAPNSGKTTLYNWITGSKSKTVNYPGSTVEFASGESMAIYGDAPLSVLDTPGIYSFDAQSPEERVTVGSLFENKDTKWPDLVAVVLDATQLGRHLLILRQAMDSGLNCVVVVTMMDLLKTRGQKLNIEKLSAELALPVFGVDGRLGGGIKELVGGIRSRSEKLPAVVPQPKRKSWDANAVNDQHRWANNLVARVIEETHQETKRRDVSVITEKWDKILLHPVGGLIIFALIMSTLFSSVFWLARPLMDLVSFVFSWMGEQVSVYVANPIVSDFLANGILASFGAVLVFVPQIFILFLGLVLLEDTGYLARASALIDKPMSKLGLNGKSFVPLLSAHACAVPAMMAARTISNRKERLLTLFIVPLMTCSARLPVYALLLAFVLLDMNPWVGGVSLAVIYFASIFFGGIVAAVVNRFLPDVDSSYFMMELPYYRRPHLGVVFRTALQRIRSYLRSAGPVIFVLSLIIWLLTTFPGYQIAEKSERIGASYAAYLGRLIEPLMHPMGVDWRVGLALLSAFAAREVFVSTLAIIFNVTESSENLRETLLQSMTHATNSAGAPIFTFATVAGLIVFFMIALQCLATFSISHRESGSLRFAVFQLIAFNVIAYILAVATVQGLRLVGFV